MQKSKAVVIVGGGEFAEIAYEYFTKDSEYTVTGFAVNKEYMEETSIKGLPVVPVEEMETRFPPEKYDVYVAVSYVQLNRVRKRLYQTCRRKGYHCASYVSSRAFVWDNVQIGENSFIFENNTLQYNVKVGNNVVIWSGNHIGHSTRIEDDVWITSHVVISGYCRIGAGSFLGVNATLGDEVGIAKDVVLGAGALTVKNLEEAGQVYIGSPAKKTGRTSYEQFHVKMELPV